MRFKYTMPIVHKRPRQTLSRNIVLALLLTLPPPVSAQTVPQIPALPPPQVTTAKNGTGATAEHVALVRATLSSLNDANITGNYSVLRDAAAPSFAERYTVADLAAAFMNLRSNPNFLAASQLPPNIMSVSQPSADVVVLRGQVRSVPGTLEFNAQYQRIGKRWRLSALAVSLPSAKTARTVPDR